jgi:hypothetical protein
LPLSSDTEDDMTISGQPATSLLDSLLKAEQTRTEMGVAVLKKAQDSAKQQGEAMVQMLEQSAPRPEYPRLDVYA